MNSLYVVMFFLWLILFGPVLTLRIKEQYFDENCTDAEALTAYQMLQQRLQHLDLISWSLLLAHATFISTVMVVIWNSFEHPTSLHEELLPFWRTLQTLIKPWYTHVQFVFLLPLSVSIFKLASLRSRLFILEQHTSLGYCRPWKPPWNLPIPRLNTAQWLHLWMAFGAWAFCAVSISVFNAQASP